MKRIKKCLMVILALCLITANAFNCFALEEVLGPVKFSVSGATASIGETFKVKVSVSGNVEIDQLYVLEFTYDESCVEYVGAITDSALIKSCATPDNAYTPETKILVLGYASPIIPNGEMITYEFRVKPGCKTMNTEISFQCLATSNRETVTSQTIPAVITITCSHTNKTLTPAKDSNCKEQGNNAYYTCTDCGAILKEDGKTVTTVEQEKLPLGDHTYVKHDKVEPDHKNAGMAEYYTCSVCPKIFNSDKNEVANTDGFKLEPIPHTFGEEWKYNETGHWHECECGEKTPAEAHTINWTVVKEATEEKEGLEKGVCSVCRYETSRPIPPPTHEHTIEKVDAKPATCAAEGNIEHYTCTKCHKLFSDEAGKNEIENISTPKNPDNHTGETKVVGELAPNCKDYGYTGDTVCDGCGEVLAKGEPIPPTEDHKNTEVRNAKDADCIHEGYTGDTYCLDCEAKIETGTIIKPTGIHDFEWVTVKEAKFNEAGLERQVCKVCQEVGEEREIPPLDCFHSAMEHHEKVAATCINTGTVEYWRCTECNRNYSDEKGTREITDTVLPIDPTNHVHTEIRNASPATCVSTGNSGDTYCTDCGTLVTAGNVTSVDPNAHHYINNVCTYCGHVRIVYRPTTYMYIDDYSHLASGIKERHVPDSMTKHTDGEYEWSYCLYCQHEYGKVPVVNVSVDDTVDIVVDDPVQSGDDETIPDVPVTEPQVNEPVQDTNPPTGIAIALLPLVLAAGAVALIKRK